MQGRGVGCQGLRALAAGPSYRWHIHMAVVHVRKNLSTAGWAESLRAPRPAQHVHGPHAQCPFVENVLIEGLLHASPVFTVVAILHTLPLSLGSPLVQDSFILVLAVRILLHLGQLDSLPLVAGILFHALMVA